MNKTNVCVRDEWSLKIGGFLLVGGQTKRQTFGRKAKRQKVDRKKRPKREFNIVMSGQFHTLAMFL